MESKVKKPVEGVAQGDPQTPDPCAYNRFMNKTNPLSSLYTKEIALLELQDFMFDTMLPADDCVDWFCDRFDVNATDDVIDFVVDAHFAFHGE